jgi:Caspase domain
MRPAIAILVTAQVFAFLFGPEAALAAKKAFVVGINNYTNVAKLKTAVNDAKKIADQLSQLGYDATVVTDADATRTKLLVSWQRLLNGLKEGDDVVFFYSGHGVEVQGTNYLVPIDTPRADDLGGEDSLKHLLISFPSLLEDLNKKPLNGIVWILDACRDNPFKTAGKSLGGTNGLVNMEGPAGTFIFYSAGFGQTALDYLPNESTTGKNSVYTRTLLNLLPVHSHDPVTTLATTIRPMVRDLARPHDQRPAYYDGMDGPWCFAACNLRGLQTSFQTATKSIISPSNLDVAAAVQDSIVTSKSLKPAALDDHITPNAVFLGKKSATHDCDGRVSDNFPFGCDLLRKLLSNGPPDAVETQRRQLIGVPLTVQTAVNVRLRAPTVNEKGAGRYTCVVDTLASSSTVTLSGILEIAYAGDTFYWGTLAGDVKGC